MLRQLVPTCGTYAVALRHAFPACGKLVAPLRRTFPGCGNVAAALQEKIPDCGTFAVELRRKFHCWGRLAVMVQQNFRAINIGALKVKISLARVCNACPSLANRLLQDCIPCTILNRKVYNPPPLRCKRLLAHSRAAIPCIAFLMLRIGSPG